MVVRNKVLLKGDPLVADAVVASGQTITPGHLIAFNATGQAIVHATANGLHGSTFAVERRYIGEGIDDTIGAGEDLQYVRLTAGMEVYALLETGANATPATPLVSNGTGALQLATTETGKEIVGYPTESLNNTSGADARISVRII